MGCLVSIFWEEIEVHYQDCTVEKNWLPLLSRQELQPVQCPGPPTRVCTGSFVWGRVSGIVLACAIPHPPQHPLVSLFVLLGKQTAMLRSPKKKASLFTSTADHVAAHWRTPRHRKRKGGIHTKKSTMIYLSIFLSAPSIYCSNRDADIPLRR